MSQVKLHHLSLSRDADKDVPEVDWDYLRTVTAVMTVMVFNFLLCDCNEGMFKNILSCFSCQMWGCDLYSNKYGKFI